MIGGRNILAYGANVTICEWRGGEEGIFLVGGKHYRAGRIRTAIPPRKSGRSSERFKFLGWTHSLRLPHMQGHPGIV